MLGARSFVFLKIVIGRISVPRGIRTPESFNLSPLLHHSLIYEICSVVLLKNVIWALARALDLYWNIHQVVTSSNNSIQHTIKVPDELSARALKHICMACYGTRLSLSLDSLSLDDDRKMAKRDLFNWI